MASEAQIAANRRNAQKSTGPKSDAGKAKTARNAMRHGLNAKHVVSHDENAADFFAFYEAQRALFAPQDAIEEQLVERIAICAWRLRRLPRAEAELINAWYAKGSYTHGTVMGTVFGRASSEMGTLSRYEAALDRALRRASEMLERRQARRRDAAIRLEEGGENKNTETKPISFAESEVESQSRSAEEPPSLPSPSRGEGRASRSEAREGVNDGD